MTAKYVGIKERKFHLLENENASENFESTSKTSVITHYIFWTIKNQFFYYFPLHIKAFSIDFP